MPEMDGITALSLMMAERPVPVVMVSSLTEKGALATFEALGTWGRSTTSPNPAGTISLSIDEIKDELLTKVRAAAQRPRCAAGAACRGWRSGCASSRLSGAYPAGRT
jgi:two-component system chemotaxis response regulator CheB